MSRPETIFDFDDTDRELVNRSGGGGGGLLETSSTLTSYETEGGAISNKERKRKQLTAVYEGFQRLRPTPTTSSLGKEISSNSLVPKEGLGWYKDSEGGDRYFLNGVRLDLNKSLAAWERYPQVDKETYLKNLINRITTTKPTETTTKPTETTTETTTKTTETTTSSIKLPPRIKLPECHNNSLSSLTPHSLATLHHTGNLEKDITSYLYPATDKFSGPDDPILPMKRHLKDLSSSTSRPTKRPTTTTATTLPKSPLPSSTTTTSTTAPFSTSSLSSYLTSLQTTSSLQATLHTRTQAFLDKTKVLTL